MKTRSTNSFITFLSCLVLVTSGLSSQPVNYPPQEPNPISSCQIDANCALGNSLNSVKDAVGLMYRESEGPPKSSKYSGTGFLLRQAGSSGGILMAAGHFFAIINAKWWIRYRYRSNCGGTTLTGNEQWIYFDQFYNYQGDTTDGDVTAIKLLFVDNGPNNNDHLPRLGWTLLDQSGQSAKSLGHPNGNSLKVTSFNSLTKIVESHGHDAYQMSLNQGYIDNGQSGSPVINSAGYYLGTAISTDTLTCSGNSPTGPVYAQRLSKYYRSFSEYLDPYHTGAVQVPTWLPGGTNIGEYKYPSLASSANTICAGNVGYVSINNFCEFMEGYVNWSVSNPSLVNITESSDQKTLQISPAHSSSSGALTVTATIDFGGWFNSYYTTIQIGKINSSQVTITGPNMVCPNEYFFVSCSFITGVDNYDWQWGSTFQYFGGQGTRWLDLMAAYNFNGDAILLRTHNACGWWTGTPTVKYIQKNYSYCGYSYSMSPNPSSDGTVTIEAVIEEETLREDADFAVVFNVQIFDAGNNKIMEFSNIKSKIEFDIRKLKKGQVYIVNITDNQKTESRKLLVN